MNKSELIAALRLEYRNWQELLDQVHPARMEQPGVNGDWSMKDVIAHMTGWNRKLVDQLQAAVRKEPEPPRPWPADLESDDDINAWIYESYRGRPVREVLDESQQVFEHLFAVLHDLPEDVRIETVERGSRVYLLTWLGDTRYPPGEFFDHWHDDHEPDIRAWLARQEKK